MREKKITSSRFFLILILAEAILLAAAGLWAFRCMKNLKPTGINIHDMTCLYTVYHDGAFSIEDDMRSSGKEVDFLFGPATPLKKGSYVAHIEYETEKDQYVLAGGTNSKMLLVIPPEFVKASKGILSRNSSTLSYKFEIPEDVQEFNLIFHYNGEGKFRIKSLSVNPTATYYKRTLASWVFVFAGIDLIWLLSKRSRTARKDALLILGMAFCASIPIFFNRVGMTGGDMEFHLLRIEAVKQALLDRQFPPRIPSTWLYGYGFPASIYYNDILFLLPAFLRILGYDIVFSYKAYLCAVNLLSAVIAVWSFRGIFRSKKIGNLAAFSYMLAPYRLVDVYIRMAVGEFTAFTFLPLIAYGVVNMYKDDGSDWKKYHKYGIAMALGISGVVASHVLTLLILVFFLAVVFLVFYKRSFRKNTLRLWIDTGILSVLLSAYFLVPFVDYYFNVSTLVKQNALVRGSGMIQYNGVSLGRLLSFFPTSFPVSTFFISDTLMPLTPGLLLFLVLIYGCYRSYKTGTKKYLPTIGLSLLSLYLSTDFCPWNFLEAHTHIGQLLAQVQFPFRFLMVSNITLCLLLGELLTDVFSENNELRQKAEKAVLLLNFIFLIFFVSDYSSGRLYEKKYEYESLDSFVTGLLYLPTDAPTDRYDYTTEILSENIDEVRLLSRKIHTMQLHIVSENGGSVEVPILNYKGYHVHDAEGNEYPIYKGKIGRIGFRVPEHFSSDVTVAFIDPWYWQAAIYVSLCSWVILLGVILKKKYWQLEPERI
ncbi:MAG: hypothetical protein IJI41_08545 [Anaerolineaceae bacterium]|nr:hypothetical protein [Anaerolineaceae bacterium]